LNIPDLASHNPMHFISIFDRYGVAKVLLQPPWMGRLYGLCDFTYQDDYWFAVASL
jgi:hypothetical protein